MKNSNGFTLVELLVVTAILGVLIVSIVGILLNTFKAKSIIGLTNKVEANANYINGEIRKNLIGSEGRNVLCFGNSIQMSDLNGNQTILSCVEAAGVSTGNVASASATATIQLKEDDVSVTGCGSFVSCELSPATGFVSKVNVGYTLSAGLFGGNGGAENYFSRSFTTSVTLRN